MKQVVVRGGEVLVLEVPEPVLEPGTLIVDVLASCISTGTELSGIASANDPLWRRAARNPAKVKKAAQMLRSQGLRHTVSVVHDQVATATPVGYSAAGVVRAVAPDVEGFRPGDRVACAGAGVANHASVARVPVNLAVPVPPAVSFVGASTVALGAIALQGARRAAPGLGEAVAVVGLGAIGQLTAQLLKAAGCRVLVADPDPGRVETALAYGADGPLAAAGGDPEQEAARLTSGAGLDAVIITAASSSDEVISRAFRFCRKKGRVVLVGDVGLRLDRSDFYAKELDLMVSTSYGPGRYDRRYEEDGLDYPIGYVRWTENRNMEEFLRMVAEGKVKVEPLVGRTWPLDEAPSAYKALASAGRPLSAVIQYGEPVGGPPALLTPARRDAPVRPSAGRRQLRVALVGAGSFARSMYLPTLRALAHLFELRWVVSRAGLGAAELARQYSAAHASTKLEDALGDEQVDAVLIATNHDSHASLALRCLQAGKHALVEKPLALSEAELALLKDFFDDGAGGPRPLLMTGFNRRFSVHAVEAARRLSRRSSPLLISYRVNAGWLEPGHWVYGPAGGGRNRGEACHMYDLFGFLTGAKASSVQATVIGPVTGAYHRDDNFIAVVAFEDGSVASLTYSSLGPSGVGKERCELFWDGNAIVLDDFRTTVMTGGRGTTSLADGADKGHRAELEAFAHCALGGGDWPVPLWQQIQATGLALQVERLLHGAPGPLLLS